MRTKPLSANFLSPPQATLSLKIKIKIGKGHTVATTVCASYVGAYARFPPHNSEFGNKAKYLTLKLNYKYHVCNTQGEEKHLGKYMDSKAGITVVWGWGDGLECDCVHKR